MKKYIGIYLVLSLFSILSYNAGKTVTRHHNFKAERYAAEWGCLAGSEQSCRYLHTEKELNDCRENALVICPKAGESFENFMSKSYDKKK
jgi:hypothetical protein